MTWSRLAWFTGAVVVALFLVPFTASAQQASGIAGEVTDDTGGVLPGVTVEATSPALIEGVRTAFSDGQGRYNIVDLRPGTYTVTFALPGFATVIREGIVLTAGFTANIDAAMQVGGIEETITVTGASPLVDIQNVRQQQVVSDELLRTLPSSTKNVAQTLIMLVPGITGTTDVGGSSGLYRSNGQSGGMFFHGKSDITALYDGMGVSASATAIFYVLNTATAEETTVETGGGSAESGATVVMNLIPKVGGNTFGFDASGTYTNERLQTNNLTDELRARGLTHPNEVLLFYDANVTVGGPIMRDRLWFFSASRAVRSKNTVPGVFFNKTLGTPFYTPDPDRPAYRTEWLQSLGGRVTWQASEKNKVSGFTDIQHFFNRGRGEFASPEAYTHMWNFWPQGLGQATWTSPVSNRLLLEAGTSFMVGPIPYPSPGGAEFATTGPEAISIVELSTGFRYNARQWYANAQGRNRWATRASASYVTGSHAFKGGIQLEQVYDNQDRLVHGDVEYFFNQGVPNRLRQHATYAIPSLRKNRSRELALFVQDQWAINRLTLNYGLRFDAVNGWAPAQSFAASRFLPARDFAPVHDIPALTDLSPRLGLSYDLFGTGRTAVKVSFGRFVEKSTSDLVSRNNPHATSVNSVDRNWNDANGNFVPDCDLLNPAANGECGPFSDQNFGQNNPKATQYSDDVLRGYGNRNYSWDMSTEVQHELRPGVSLTAGYYRNWAGNWRVTDNLAVTPADFEPYCITAPVDPGLPDGGGYEVCGLYDIKPEKFGQSQNLVTNATKFIGSASGVTCGGQRVAERAPTSGRACGTSDFFGVNLDTRFTNGASLGGGFDTGRTVIDNCFVIDSPQQLLNCRTVIAFKNQTSVKVFGNIPLPGDVAVSGTLQNLAGRPFEADYRAPNAAIAPSLGRNLARCGTRVVCTAVAAVPLVSPYTLFLERRTLVNVRLSKSFTMGRARLRANFDVYNLLNGSAVLGVVDRFGPNWQQPAAQKNVEVDSILPGRMLHLGGSLQF